MTEYCYGGSRSSGQDAGWELMGAGCTRTAPGSCAAAPLWADQPPPSQALAPACHRSKGCAELALQHATPATSQQLSTQKLVEEMQQKSRAKLCMRALPDDAEDNPAFAHTKAGTEVLGTHRVPVAIIGTPAHSERSKLDAS